MICSQKVSGFNSLTEGELVPRVQESLQPEEVVEIQRVGAQMVEILSTEGTVGHRSTPKIDGEVDTAQ